MTSPEQHPTWLRYGVHEASRRVCILGGGVCIRAVRILAGWGVHLGGIRIQGYTQLRGGPAFRGGGSSCGGYASACPLCSLSCKLYRSCMIGAMPAMLRVCGLMSLACVSSQALRIGPYLVVHAVTATASVCLTISF